MVQGLAFLSKKSWHVKNMNNQEKVWMAEQRKAHEESKTTELARQIQQERERDELDAIAGKKSSHLDRGIAWMHEGGMGEAAKEDQQKKNEEYLMGKQYTAEGVKGGDFAVDEVNDGVNAVVASAALPATALSSQTGPSVADKNEAFRMRHEDPMFLVSKRHYEEQAKVEKTKALYERVIGPQSVEIRDGYDERKESKRIKKERKSERKRRHHDSDDRKHRQSCHRSRSRDRDDYEEDRKSHKTRKRSHRSRSSSAEIDRRARPVAYDLRDQAERHDRRRREPSGMGNNERDSTLSRQSAWHLEDSKYGLQGSIRKEHLIDELGPSRDVLLQKRELKEKTMRSVRGVASNRHKMTEEERAKALMNMRKDGSRRADMPMLRPNHSNDSQVNTASRGSAMFLSDMTQQMYGIQNTSVQSVSSHVNENRYKNQRQEDSFL